MQVDHLFGCVLTDLLLADGLLLLHLLLLLLRLILRLILRLTKSRTCLASGMADSALSYIGLHHNGPNHLGLWLIGFSSNIMALITSGCGTCLASGMALLTEFSITALDDWGEPSRRRDCHFADNPSPSTLKRLLKGEGVPVK